MSTAILISFLIPAIVATVLTIMLIQEKDYFFHNKHNYSPLETDKSKEKNKKNNSSDDLSNLDFSGGTMGF